MAKVSDKVQQIRQAVYGKDVRESIASGIETINEQVEVLDVTFKQLIINAGESNAEIVAARVKADATAYPTLGDRLNAADADFEEQKTEIANARGGFDTLRKKLDSYAINVKDFGAKGDGTTNDTTAIQSAFDSINSGIILIPPGIYKVQKNLTLAEFPNNDQPCLLLKNKYNLKIIAYGATFKVDNHAQGILELQLCSNIEIEGLTLEGPGIFPALDGTTGRGEKGTSTEGYDTVGFWGYYKNNSYDTSANTSGGNVPKPWGTFNGGYIGNVAYGILIHRGCKNIILRDCEARGFNYAGFGVGHNGDYYPTNLNYPDNENIIFDNCYAHDCYDAGFHLMAVDGVKLINCKVEHIGHYDAQITDTYNDPGYGITCRATVYSRAKNVVVSKSCFVNCVRRGIDSHTGENLNISDNNIKECWAGGIEVTWTATDQPSSHVIISRNQLFNSGLKSGAIYYSGNIDANYSKANINANVEIHANLCINCGGGNNAIIHARTFDKLIISNNIIQGVDSRAAATYGILAGKDASNISYMLTCANNIIDAFGSTLLLRGIQIQYVAEGNVYGNLVKIEHSNANVGLYSIGNDKVNFFGNHVILGSIGTPLGLAQTNGIVYGNTSVGGNSVNSIAYNKSSDASFNNMIANAFATKFDIIIADDNVFTFTPPRQRFIALINDDSGRWVIVNSINNETIVEILKSADTAIYSATILTGTTGTDGNRINVGKSGGILYIENRSGGTRQYTLTILG